MKKDELPGIDEHGKNATNWIISLPDGDSVFQVSAK